MISKSTLESVVANFSDKAQAALDSIGNAAKSIRKDAKNNLLTKVEVAFDGTTVLDSFVGLAFLKQGADVVWQDVSAVVDANTTGLQGELGVLDDAGTFTKLATLGTHTGNVCRATVEAYADSELADDAVVVIKLKGTPPTSGTAAIYLPYIALT